MDFEFSPKVKELQKKLTEFMDENVYKNEKVFEGQLNENGRWSIPPILEELKLKAKNEGLWNLFLPESEYGAGFPKNGSRPGLDANPYAVEFGNSRQAQKINFRKKPNL